MLRINNIFLRITSMDPFLEKNETAYAVAHPLGMSPSDLAKEYAINEINKMMPKLSRKLSSDWTITKEDERIAKDAQTPLIKVPISYFSKEKALDLLDLFIGVPNPDPKLVKWLNENVTPDKPVYTDDGTFKTKHEDIYKLIEEGMNQPPRILTDMPVIMSGTEKDKEVLQSNRTTTLIMHTFFVLWQTQLYNTFPINFYFPDESQQLASTLEDIERHPESYDEDMLEELKERFEETQYIKIPQGHNLLTMGLGVVFYLG